MYVEFLADKQSRKKMLYVGANDGMLHASTPTRARNNSPTSRLGFTEPEQANGSRPLTAISWTAVRPPGMPASVRRRKRLLQLAHGARGLLGAGGKTIYALDITDPASADFGKPLWEFSDDDLGYLAVRPRLSSLRAVIGRSFLAMAIAVRTVKICSTTLSPMPTAIAKRSCSPWI